MKKKEKILIIVLLIILIITIIFFVKVQNKDSKEQNDIEENFSNEKYVQVLEDGTKINTSTKLKEMKEINGLKFENIQLTEKNGQTILLADLTNNNKKRIEFTLVDVVFMDEKGNEIVTVGGIINPLNSGEKTQFSTSMTLNYVDAYDFQIVIK